ncbi:MAG TPA: cytochrome C biogenesis protein [Bacteroidetes bacterium]|nr:cytochrome C biogenesis protein [Bacteroidota bacterium]
MALNGVALRKSPRIMILMKTTLTLVNYLLPALYFLSAGSYAMAFFQKSLIARKAKTHLLTATILIHLLYLGYRTIAFEHPPITTVFEILSVIALTTALSYRIIEGLARVKNTGFFVLVIPFLFQLLSTILIRDLEDVNPVLRSNLLGFHVMSALLGLSAFAISAVYGFLYLLLYHNIKSSRLGLIYENLPDLEKLERMATISVFSGFVLLTIAIVIGLLWLPKAFADYSYFDPKLLGTVFIWLLYGAGLVARLIAGWKGRKIMVLSIAGFAISFLSMTVINVFLSGFHNFS